MLENSNLSELEIPGTTYGLSIFCSNNLEDDSENIRKHSMQVLSGCGHL